MIRKQMNNSGQAAMLFQGSDRKNGIFGIIVKVTLNED